MENPEQGLETCKTLYSELKIRMSAPDLLTAATLLDRHNQDVSNANQRRDEENQERQCGKRRLYTFQFTIVSCVTILAMMAAVMQLLVILKVVAPDRHHVVVEAAAFSIHVASTMILALLAILWLPSPFNLNHLRRVRRGNDLEYQQHLHDEGISVPIYGVVHTEPGVHCASDVPTPDVDLTDYIFDIPATSGGAVAPSKSHHWVPRRMEILADLDLAIRMLHVDRNLLTFDCVRRTQIAVLNFEDALRSCYTGLKQK